MARGLVGPLEDEMRWWRSLRVVSGAGGNVGLHRVTRTTRKAAATPSKYRPFSGRCIHG